MAEVTVTTNYPIVTNMGARTLFIWRLTDVDDAETLTTNLGTRIISHMVNWTGNPGTQTSGGGHTVLAATTGIITFYPGENDLGADVWVMADGA